MTVKEFLKQYGEAERQAERLKKEYQEEVERIGSIKSPADNDGMPHGTNISKTVELQAIRLAEKAEEYKEAQIYAMKKRQEVFDVIWNVPGIEGQILYERYINLKNWDDVAESVHYSLQHVHRLHGAVLLELQNVIE